MPSRSQFSVVYRASAGAAANSHGFAPSIRPSAQTVSRVRPSSSSAENRKYVATLVWTKLATQTKTPVSTGYSKRKSRYGTGCSHSRSRKYRCEMSE